MPEALVEGDSTDRGAADAHRGAPLHDGDPRRLGRYELVAVLGEGGMGRVYLGRTDDGRQVAVKVIRPEIASDADFRRRFRNEVSRARQVPPFSTAEVIDADPDHDPPYLVVEYVDGPSLADVVAHEGPLTVANVHRIAVGVAVALTGIHNAGVIHRDLKPANVLLARGSPRVIDFGIAKPAIDPTGVTDGVLGTIPYMAPERFYPAERASTTPATDIFAWGAIVAFAANGRHPFSADSTGAVIGRILHGTPDLTGLSEPLRGIVKQALANNPNHRPTARKLLDLLTNTTTPTWPSRISRTTWIPAGLWVVAIIFAVVVAASDPTGGVSALSKTLAGLGALATLVSLVRGFWPSKTGDSDSIVRSEDTSIMHDADRLAYAVKQAWTIEARVRRLRDPWLLPVNWRTADNSLFSVPEVVFRSPRTGMIVPESERGPKSAELGALIDLFVALPSRRLVILGSPGSGKSVAVIELTLALLERRGLGEAVPVPLQLASWNPAIDLNEWLVQQIVENYSLASDKHRDPQAIAQGLVDRGEVLAVLDGLDEIPGELRAPAIRSVNRSLHESQPVILTCRTDDYRTTVRNGTVVAKSYAVELQPVDPRTACRYLTEASPGGEASMTWADVFAKMGTDPRGPLAAILRSPLMISMAREIYCEGPRDPRDLLSSRLDSQDALELHLLGELVPVTYQHDRPVRPARRRWPEHRPAAWLRYLAVRVSGPGSPNITWWQVERGISPLVTGVPPVAVTTIVVGWLVGWWPAVAFAIVGLGGCATWRTRQWSLETVLVRLRRRPTADLPNQPGHERTARWAALTVGRLLGAGAAAAYGYAHAHATPVTPEIVAEAVRFGVPVGLATGFFAITPRYVPTEIRVASYRGVTPFMRRFLIYLVMALPALATIWVLFQSFYAVLVVALAFVVCGLIDGINVWLDVPADVTRALSPRSTRNDERFASFARSLTIAMTLAGVTLALYTVASKFVEGIIPALVIGMGFGLADPLMGLATSVWGRYTLANAWLAVRGDLPWRLMRFLDDAHRRGLLRRAGAVYQFRHARLQEHLATDGRR